MYLQTLHMIGALVRMHSSSSTAQMTCWRLLFKPVAAVGDVLALMRSPTIDQRVALGQGYLAMQTFGVANAHNALGLRLDHRTMHRKPAAVPFIHA
jgi:hypothetical protein